MLVRTSVPRSVLRSVQKLDLRSAQMSVLMLGHLLGLRSVLM